MSKLQIYQLNVGHAAFKQERLIDDMLENDIDLAFITEPYLLNERLQASTAKYCEIVNGRSAVMIKKSISYVQRYSDIPDTVIVDICGMWVIAVYMSPNENNENLLQSLHDLINNNAMNKRPLLLLGDFNAHSAIL